VGFGSQTLVKDLISGLFILFEESIRVGDWAMVGNQGGSVESVGLRTVKLRDMNGTLHVISNSSIDSLSNFSKVFSRTVMDIGVAYREDVDEVIELLKELGATLQKTRITDPTFWNRLKFSDWTVLKIQPSSFGPGSKPNPSNSGASNGRFTGS
jgi:small-conductance mechanosensitive channel